MFPGFAFLLVLFSILFPLGSLALGHSLSHMQTICFPVVLLGVAAIARFSRLVPVWVPGFALLGWLMSLGYGQYCHARAADEFKLRIHSVAGDVLNVRARGLERYTAMVSRNFGLPLPVLSNSSFSSLQGAAAALLARSHSGVLVYPQGENWSVLVGGVAGLEFCGLEASDCREVVDLAESYGILEKQNGKTVNLGAVAFWPRFSRSPLLLGVAPEQIALSAQPLDVTAQYIAWMSYGLGLLQHPALDSLQRVRAEDAFLVARRLRGFSGMTSPTAAASLLVGVSRLLPRTEIEPQTVRESAKDFIRAKKLSRKEFDPEIHALALNNLAVAQLNSKFSPKSLKAIRRLLHSASLLRSKDGRPVLGARIALVNLSLLEREVS